MLIIWWLMSVISCFRSDQNSVISTLALGEDTETRQTKGTCTKYFYPRTRKIQRHHVRPFTCYNFVTSPGTFRVFVPGEKKSGMISLFRFRLLWRSKENTKWQKSTTIHFRSKFRWLKSRHSI